MFGLWPLTFVAFFLSATLTESGLFSRDVAWAFLVTAITLVSGKKRAIDEANQPVDKRLEPVS